MKEWVSIKEMLEMKVAGKNNVLDAIKLLHKEKRIKSVTRKKGLEQGLKISKEGSANEVFYALGSEEVVVNSYTSYADAVHA
jgi:AAA15 family ATPase/GTPase